MVNHLRGVHAILKVTVEVVLSLREPSKHDSLGASLIFDFLDGLSRHAFLEGTSRHISFQTPLRYYFLGAL